MTVAYSNNATSKLSASISNVATSLSVTTGHGARFPSLSAGIWFYLTLISSSGSNEIVKVTARSGDTMTVERAQDGTSALAFSVDDVVELRITKAMLDDFKIDAQTGYLPLSGGTLTGDLTVGGNLLLSPVAGGNRIIGFSGGTDTTLVLQAGGTSGTGANLELTRDYFAYLDANTIRLRNVSASTTYVDVSATATNVVTGALQQGGNQVLHAGNYTSYSPGLGGFGAQGTWPISVSGAAAFAPWGGITGKPSTFAGLGTPLEFSDVTAGLGYTPYNGDSNPYGFITSAALSPYATSASLGSYLAKSGGTMTGAITFAAGQTWPTFNQNTTGSAATLTTSRMLTIGDAGKFFDGSTGVTWSLAEIGAAAASHSHSYLPLIGGALSGGLAVTGSLAVTGAITQGGFQVLHAGNYSSYALSGYGAQTINGSLTVASTDPTIIIKDTDSGSGGTGKLVFQDSSNTTWGGIEYNTYGALNVFNNNWNGTVTINGYQALTSGNYTTTVTAINGFNATGTWPISVTGTANSANYAYSIAGGVARSIPYQNGVGSTVFTTAGQSGQHLRVNGFNTGFEWVAESSMSVSSASYATTAGALNANLPVTRLGSGTGASASTFWRGDGTWATPAAAAPTVTAGTAYLLSGSNSIAAAGGTAYNFSNALKARAIANGTVRLSYELGGSSYTTYGQVYKNGVAAAAEQSQGLSAFVTRTVDITVAYGDLIQIVCRASNAAGAGTSQVRSPRFGTVQMAIPFTDFVPGSSLYGV